jgi:MFS family permease
MEGWRRNLYVVWFATFASLTGGSLVQPFLPLFINRDLGITDAGEAAIWFGIATSGGGVAQAILAPIWGVLADRHGRKAMLVRAQFAIGAANATMSFVGSPFQLVVLRVFQGMFRPGRWSPAACRETRSRTPWGCSSRRSSWARC